MIELKGIHKKYKLGKAGDIHVLKGINLKFRENEFVSILGPSGCGKTTLLNIVGGLDHFDEGNIYIDGVETKDYKASDWDNYRNKHIGFVFQAYNLITHLNVINNVAMPLIMAGVKKEEYTQRALAALDRVGLADQAKKTPLQLSGGQMQRVAIARALVTNPKIILADEPTGALDAESSIQVMDILQEVSKDHLIVMVTHNDLLAEKYSTRIVRISDGEIMSDSNPYDIEAEQLKVDFDVKEEAQEDIVAEEEQSAVENAEPIVEGATTTTKEAQNKKKQRKAKLSFWSAAHLSLLNLRAKKVRTSLTAFAGSIGIIGIVLVLAFNTGINRYISSLESMAMSFYPISVERRSINMSSLSNLTSSMTGTTGKELYPDTEDIYVNDLLASLIIDALSSMFSTNDLKSFKKYVDENLDTSLGYAKYNYSTQMNVYTKSPTKEGEYIKVEPFGDATGSLFGEYVSSDFSGIMTSYTNILSGWEQMIPSRDVIKSQYELVGENSRWPRQEVYQDENGDYVTEVLITVDKTNSLNDYQLFMLGLISSSEFLSMKQKVSEVYNVNQLMQLEYYILAQTDYYEQKGTDEWIKNDSTKSTASFVEGNSAIKAKVVGVIRPKEDGQAQSINGVIAYDISLMEWLIDYVKESPALIAQKDSPNKNIVTGTYLTEKMYKELLVEMGEIDLEEPTGIYLYAYSFDAKDKILQFIEDYNKQNKDKKINYTDTLGALMSYVNSLTTVVRDVLIGFCAVSLIVSSIMIAVIIYTSVLERRKEVGILRSIGARKADVTMIFMTESGILGLLAGVLGVLIGWIITIPVNIILKSLAEIPNLAILAPQDGIIMVLVSFVLAVVAGIIPALQGARMDPAAALRNE